MDTRNMEIPRLDLKFKELREDILEICKANNMIFRFEAENFPILAIVEADPVHVNQIMIALTEGAEETTNNGKIEFIFDDELKIKMDKRMNMSEALFNKIKNKVKKLHYIYLQVFFYSYMEHKEKHEEERAQADYMMMLADQIINGKSEEGEEE